MKKPFALIISLIFASIFLTIPLACTFGSGDDSDDGITNDDDDDNDTDSDDDDDDAIPFDIENDSCADLSAPQAPIMDDSLDGSTISLSSYTGVFSWTGDSPGYQYEVHIACSDEASGNSSSWSGYSGGPSLDFDEDNGCKVSSGSSDGSVSREFFCGSTEEITDTLSGCTNGELYIEFKIKGTNCPIMDIMDLYFSSGGDTKYEQLIMGAVYSDTDSITINITE